MRKILTFIILMGFLNNLFGQKNKKEDYQPNWTIYLTKVDDTLSSIRTDLNVRTIAPVKGQETVIYIPTTMPNPREDGLMSQEDTDEMWKIEDDLIKAFEKEKIHFTYIGCLTSKGIREYFFYGENLSPIEKQVSNVMASYPKIKYTIEHELDKEWNYYFDFLYPSPKQMQMIENISVLEILEKEGDDLTKEREVYHWIYFNTKEELEQFEAFTKKLGFKTYNKGETDSPDKYKYSISVFRVDKVGYNDIDEYTLELWEKANELNGDYDGWETSVEK